ncbi:Heat-inducible transcription repressor HrcA [Gossypium australe]|uniref:Heat-inducible transcription repressor HrcA n=1 Tax=Gossypium australe TaxID=47621 RepID=A0A5B6UU23_9ROSI|nr:Heat-inducible transcription repressor HrcA [Gossypium australe]
MNFLLLRSNQQGTPESPPVQGDMAESSYVPKSVTSLERLIVEDPFPEYLKVENHGKSNGLFGKNVGAACDKNASVIASHTDISEEDGWIIIPNKDLPDDWNCAPNIRSLCSLDRSFVFPGEQVHVLVCLSACNQETEIITPFKVAEVMSKNGMRKGTEKQNGDMEVETSSVAGGEEVSPNGAVISQNDENLEKEKIDPATDVSDSESFLRMEEQRRQTETLLKRFNNSHFFVRIAEWDEPLWSKKGASQIASDSYEIDSQQSIANEAKNTTKNISSWTAVIDRGNFDANVSSGVARDTVNCCSLSNGDMVVGYSYLIIWRVAYEGIASSVTEFQYATFCNLAADFLVRLQVNVGVGFFRDPVIEILQFEKYLDRNLSENQDNEVYANHDPCGELLKWLLPVDNTLLSPRALSSHPLGSGIGSPSHRSTLSASSGSHLFSFSNFRSYSMSSLPQNFPPSRGPAKAQSSKLSFDLDEVNPYSSQKILKSQRTGIEDILSFRGVSLERERFSVLCGLEGIHIPGRRWRRKLEIIKPVEIHSYSANCNTDDLLCVLIKNVSPAHIPDIVVYIDAITLVLEEASKGGPPASLPIACIEVGDGHCLPNLALRFSRVLSDELIDGFCCRRGEEHSFILKPASSIWKDLKIYGGKSKSSTLKPRLKTSDKKGSTSNVHKLFLKQPTNWRPRISRDLMISVTCKMSGQYSRPNERITQLPVQVLTLQASNLTPEDLTMTVLAPASFTSPPSVVSLNSYPTTPLSPFIGFSDLAGKASSERHNSAVKRFSSMPTVSENQKQNGDARTRFTSSNEQLTTISNFIPTSYWGCTHLWLQSRVPLG